MRFEIVSFFFVFFHLRIGVKMSSPWKVAWLNVCACRLVFPSKCQFSISPCLFLSICELSNTRPFLCHAQSIRITAVCPYQHYGNVPHLLQSFGWLILQSSTLNWPFLSFKENMPSSLASISLGEEKNEKISIIFIYLNWSLLVLFCFFFFLFT